MKRITLNDIAAEVGVSKSVVYSVLNNREGKGIFFSKETKKKVTAVAKRLGYVSPKSAREFFTGKSDTIGILIHKIIPPFSGILNHLQQEAWNHNLEITPYITNGEPALEEHYLNIIRDRRVDAMIALVKTDGSAERYERFSTDPCNLKILLYHDPLVPGIPIVHFDALEAGRLAAEHLTARGCRKLMFFGGSRDLARYQGFSKYLADKGFPPPETLTREGYTGFCNDGISLGRELFDRKELPDGIFASNDLLAIGLIAEAQRRGLKVPGDILIMGCDNIEIGACIYPSLTTIDINIPLLAQKLLTTVKEMIEEKPVPSATYVPVNLVIRESTGLAETQKKPPTEIQTED